MFGVVYSMPICFAEEKKVPTQEESELVSSGNGMKALLK